MKLVRVASSGLNLVETKEKEKNIMCFDENEPVRKSVRLVYSYQIKVNKKGNSKVTIVKLAKGISAPRRKTFVSEYDMQSALEAANLALDLIY